MTIEQFGKAIVASGLMTADDVKAFWAAIPADGRPKNGDGFGKLLVDKSLLTPFQVAELLAGRGARLMMGDYTIVSQIGAGGMGQVYKAQHRRMKRTVALKVMSNAAMQDEAAVKRFQREVHAAAKLEHPNIVTAYDSGEAGSVKYLVMQFVDGGDLSELVKKQGRLGIEQAVGYVIQAARGLAFAHGEGVIHRDIKPANLLLDKKGVVKILDMGLARFEDGGDGLTATEQVMGTVDYMSPEQAANTKGCDGRADIYSLGCTLWFLLTAKKLYEADTLIARLMKHRDGELPSLVKERDDAPWPLEQALHKMIAKRVQDRYQSMDEVVAALAPFSGDAASSGSIGGASSGGGPSADLASFMQSMGGGGTKTNISATQQVAGTKPATSANIDATAQFSAPDAGTDPKSQILPKTSARPKPALAKKPGKPGNNRTKLIAAGALGGVLLLAGIIVKIRDKDGNVVAEVNAPTGASAEIITTPQPAVRPNTTAIPGTPVTLPIAQLLDSPDYVWGTPENLGSNVNSTSDDWKPTLAADELRMVFRGDGGASQNSSSLWECRRASIDEPFGPRARLTGSAYEDEPFLSGDGLTLLFDTHAVASGRTAKDIRVRRRLTLDAPWAKPESLPLAEDRDEQSPWLSPDELTLIYSTSGGLNGSRDLWICNRATPNARFGPSTNFHCGANSQASESCPQLLSDGRTILFSRDGKPHVTFTSQTGVFSALQLLGITEDVRDAWLSNDGRRLYFNSKRAGGLGGYDIWMMRLMPKGSATPSVPSFVASVSPSFTPSTTPATPPPPGDYALRFVQYDRAEAPNPQLNESQPFTVEAYITPGDADPNRLIGQRLFGVDSEFHFEMKDNRWRFYSTHNDATSPERFTPRRRVHLAGVRTTTGRQLFLDGKLVASMDEPLNQKSKDSEAPLVFEARGGVECTLDEIRISQGIVYDKEFAPPAKLTADSNTLALYHFDEGFGDVLKDSSGKGRDGKIISATWVKADGSPIPTNPIPATPTAATTIPAEALTFGGHRYLLVELAPGKRLRWNDAKAKSEAMGGHLATINSREELEWMQKTFRNVPAGNDSDRGTYRLWLGGIRDVQNPDQWTWITGEPFDRALWVGTGPDGAKIASPLALSWYGHAWDDTPAESLARFFLVEWDTLGAVAPPQVVGAPLDLLPLVDLGQDILQGEWSKEGAGFVTKELKTNSGLRLPVEVGEAYTLRAAFSSTHGNVSFMLPFESKGLEIALTTDRVVLCLKEPKDPNNPRATLPTAVNDAKRHEALIEVTRPSATEVKIAVSIDGTPALEWQGTRNQLQAIESRRGLAPALSVHSFLVGQSPMRLLEAQLTTTQGVTKPLRATSTTAVAPAVDDQAAVAKWLLENEKLSRIRFEIDGRTQLMTTVPTGPVKVIELNFSKSNNAGQPLTEEEVARLAVFTDLEWLELPTLTDAGLAKLAPLKKLKSLYVPGSELTPAAVATIRQFPQLEHLHAFGDDEWLKALGGMPSLRSMTFWKVKVSPEAMSWFAQYPNLKELTFFECIEVEKDPKSFVAIAPLKDCKNLTKLTLAGAAVDGAELAVLSGFTQLLELNLNTPSITEAQVKQLAAALPRCKITWKDAANKPHIFEPTAPHATVPAATTGNLFMHDPAFAQWLKDTAAQPAEAQLAAVSKKLIELNPGFDGKLYGPRGTQPPTIENGVVTKLKLNGPTITDLSPLRALTGLIELTFGGPGALKGKFTDLSSLRGLQLQTLVLSGMGQDITDLSPLAGMPLEFLGCRELSKLVDLGPLAGMSKLKQLDVLLTSVADLSPLAGLQSLEVLVLPKRLADLSPVKNLKLTHLECGEISSLEPLRGMPLKTLWFWGATVTDFAPLYELKTLTELRILNATTTAELQAALQKALPDCRVSWK